MRKDEKMEEKKKIQRNLHAPVKKVEQMVEVQYYLNAKDLCAGPVSAD